MHQMHAPHGSYAEYAVAWGYTTFHLPERTSFEGNVNMTVFVTLEP